MNSIIEQMLSLHGSRTPGEKKNGIKDVVQEIILCGLSRAVRMPFLPHPVTMDSRTHQRMSGAEPHISITAAPQVRAPGICRGTCRVS